MSVNPQDIFNLLDDQIQAPIRRKTLEVISSLDSEASVPILEADNFAVLGRLTSLLVKSKDDQEIGMILRLFVNATSVSLIISSKLVADEEFVRNFVQKFLIHDIDGKNLITLKFSVMLLSNLTVSEDGCQKFIKAVSKDDNGLVNFVKTVTSIGLKSANLPTEQLEKEESDRKSELRLYTAYILRNLTQSHDVRRILVEESLDGEVNSSKNNVILTAILPILTKSNDVLKFPVVDIVRNCCFDTDLHQILLSIGHDDFLCALLYPLLGGEQLDDDENDALPIDLQYMDSEKRRESSATVRVKLLEALYQLCATSQSREYLREKGTYYVLREYHKWEQANLDHDGDQDVAQADILCSNVVGVLIRTEEEIGFDNLRTFEEKQSSS